MEKQSTFLLQRFSDGAGGTDTGTDKDTGAGDTDIDTDTGAGGTDTGTDKDKNTGKGASKPFATFPDEQSLMSRIQRESKKSQAVFLKELGVEKPEDLKNIVVDYNKQKQDSMTEIDKLKKQAQDAETARDTATNSANSALRMADAKLIAQGLGVKTERIDKFLRLVDLNEVDVKDNKVDVQSLKGLLIQELEDMPEFKTQTTTSQGGGGDFSGSGKGEGGSGSDLLTMDAIRNMSSDQVADRIEEIRTFMTKKNK